MQEMLELTCGLAKKQGRQITDVGDWRPLLRFTRGNPLTSTVLVGQALRDRVETREQVEAYVERLRTVTRLVSDLGVNLAGVDVILRMTQQIEQLQERLEQTTAQLAEAERRLAAMGTD